MPERRWLLLLSAVAALLAAGLHLWLFADGTLNNDETAYLLQAEAIAHGHLFLHVPEPTLAHRPWFFVPRDVGLVSKYLPLVSALQAIGLRLTGSVAPVLAAFAAAVPPLVAALAREVGFAPRLVVPAAALVSLSPVVVMESALPLSYLPFLVLVTASWLLALRIGLRRAGTPAAALLGLAGSAAACARPYDAVLLLGPALLWAAWQRRSALLCLGVAVGALPLTVAVLAYDAVATGSALRLPFGLLESQDALGYGTRRLVPEDPAQSFGPLQGLAGLVLHFGYDPLRWFALGAVLVPAALIAWRRSGRAVRVLLACAAVHLLGYAFFWGPWNFSVLWGRGTRVLGPIYAVPLVVPVVLAGLPVLQQRLRSRPVRVLAALALLVSGVQLGSALVQSTVDARRTGTVLAAASRAVGELRYDSDSPYLGHPVSRLVDGVVLAALAPVPAPGAPAGDLLQLPKAVYGNAALSYALTRQERAAGPSLGLDVTLVGRTGDVLVVERGGRTTACPLVPHVAVGLTRTGATGCDTAAVPAGWPRNVYRRCPDLSCLVVAVYRKDAAGALRRRTWRRLPVQTTAEGVALLVDGEPLESAGNGWLRVQRAPG